ncbi:MAG TPA: GtrA family protein [Solirubrobacteraceae bacterium]|jgi:putative flippase GtrA
MRNEVVRFVRFGVVGASNTVLTLVAYEILTRLGVADTAASALGFAVGAANGYLLNRSWTFHADGGPATLARYVGVQGLGALLSAAGVGLAISDLSLRKLAAECVVLPAVTLLTYTLARTVVFSSARPA